MRTNLRHAASTTILAAAVGMIGPVPAQASPHAGPATVSIPTAGALKCIKLRTSTYNMIKALCVMYHGSSDKVAIWTMCVGKGSGGTISYQAYGAYVGPKEVRNHGKQYEEFSPVVQCDPAYAAMNWDSSLGVPIDEGSVGVPARG